MLSPYVSEMVCAVKSFHLTTTLQLSRTLKQALSYKHLSKSPPRRHRGCWRRRDLPSFLKESTWWPASLSVGSPSGARKPVVSTGLHGKSSCSCDQSLPAGRLLRQPHSYLGNVVSGKLFKNGKFPFKWAFLLFCLFRGKKAGAGRVITQWKAKKHIFMCDYLY